MSGIPESNGQVLLKRAPAGEMLLHDVYCLSDKSKLYREADDTPVYVVVSEENCELPDDVGELPDISPFKDLRTVPVVELETPPSIECLP